MIKVCQVIFSTNRLEYLGRTLVAQKNLNFEGCEVDRIFIDDFPKGRNNLLVKTLVNTFGYNEIYLHEQNLGLSVTWTEFWNLVKSRNYDYIWHQEDDVEILEPIRVMDLIELLQLDPSLSQVVLKRQPWYENEKESEALGTDWTYRQYRYEKDSVIFSPMASLYSVDRVRFSYSEWYKQHYPNEIYHQINFNEGMIGKALYEGYGLVTGMLKNSQGHNLVNHIGDYFVGKRVLPGEPHYEMFSRFDPEKKYNSRNGYEFE